MGNLIKIVLGHSHGHVPTWQTSVQSIFYHMPFQDGIFVGWRAPAVSNGETTESIASVG